MSDNMQMVMWSIQSHHHTLYTIRFRVSIQFGLNFEKDIDHSDRPNQPSRTASKQNQSSNKKKGKLNKVTQLVKFWKSLKTKVVLFVDIIEAKTTDELFSRSWGARVRWGGHWEDRIAN